MTFCVLSTGSFENYKKCNYRIQCYNIELLEHYKHMEKTKTQFSNLPDSLQLTI